MCFSYRLPSFGEDVSFLGLLPGPAVPAEPAGSALAASDELRAHAVWLDEKGQPVSILGESLTPAQEFLISRCLLFPEGKGLMIYSWPVGAESPPHFTEGKLRPTEGKSTFLAEHKNLFLPTFSLKKISKT